MGYKLKRRQKRNAEPATKPVVGQEAAHRTYTPTTPEAGPLEAIERAVQASSLQPRNTGDMDGFWHSTVQWVREMGDMPAYDDCANIDRWCGDALLREPYLLGAVSQAVTLMANRGWSLTGGKRIVNATSALLHRFDPVSARLPSGMVYTDDYKAAGWHTAQKRRVLSYLINNGGVFTEIQYRLEPRFTRGGWSLSQVTNLYNMDTSKVSWTNDPLFPIEYAGSKPWPAPSFFHLVCMPLDREKNYHMGLSPLFRCINLARLMIAVSEWETGTLAPDFIDSLLILNGTSVDEFNAAMKARLMTSANGNRAKRAAVIGNDDRENKISADVIPFRQMPPTMENLSDRFSIIWQGYEANLGFRGQLFDQPGGSLLGRSGVEVVSARRSAANSGGNDYHLGDMRNLNQLVMPNGVAFRYDELDVDDREEAEVNEIRARTIVELFTAQRLADDYKGGELQAFARGRGNNLGTALQFQQLMVDWGIVPPEWTESEEDIIVSDVEQTRFVQRCMSVQAVHELITAVEAGQARDDSIVRYHYDPVTDQHGLRMAVPSIRRMLDEQERSFTMGMPKPRRRMERATKKEVKAAKEALAERLEDAQAIAKGLADG